MSVVFGAHPSCLKSSHVVQELPMIDVSHHYRTKERERESVCVCTNDGKENQGLIKPKVVNKF